MKLSCPRCSRIFTRKSNLERHMKTHKDAMEIQNTETDAEIYETNRRKRRKGTVLTWLKKRKVQPEEAVGNLPEDLKEIYTDHWESIRTHSHTGNKVQDRYNFRLSSATTDDYAERLWSVYPLQKQAFKVNFSYGFILRNTTTMRLRYWHTSQNRGRVLEAPEVVRNRDDFADVIKRLHTIDILEHVRQERPNSSWVVDLVTNVTVYVNKLHDHPIGSVVILPDYIRRNNAVIGLVIDTNHNCAYTDNLCLFRCLALHRGQSRKTLERTTKTLFEEYSGKSDAVNFPGITLDELRRVEKKFKININIWELTQTTSGKLIAQSH